MIEFTLPIIPTAQARPKVTVRGSVAHAYKTKNQQANERTLEAWLIKHVPEKPLEGPLFLQFFAALPIPKSATAKQRQDMMEGYLLPTTKPDLDNIIKQLKDSMTRMRFWQDDKQVVGLLCFKIYSQSGYWKIKVREIDEF